jgi:hypothetical protein
VHMLVLQEKVPVWVELAFVVANIAFMTHGGQKSWRMGKSVVILVPVVVVDEFESLSELCYVDG